MYISNRRLPDKYEDFEIKYEDVECGPKVKNEGGCRQRLEGPVNGLNLDLKNEDFRQAGQSYR